MNVMSYDRYIRWHLYILKKKKLTDSRRFGTYQLFCPILAILISFAFTFLPLLLLCASYEYFRFNKYIQKHFSDVEKSLDTLGNGRS